MPITIELPYPPTLNNYFRVSLYGALYITTKGRRYRRDVAILIKKIIGYKLKIKCAIAIEIDMYPPDKRKRDVDNVLKCLLDSIQDSGLIEDDNQIRKLRICRRDEILNKVVVKICED